MFKDIANLIINRRQEQQILIGTVETVNPLTVKLMPDDTAISVISTTLIGIQQGSRVVLRRFGNKFIAIAVIGQAYPQFISKDGNQDINNTTAMTNLTGMIASFKAGGTYSIDVFLHVRNETSATPNFRSDWLATGTITNLTGRNCRGGRSTATTTADGTVQRSSANHGYTTAINYAISATSVSAYLTEHAVFKAETDATIQIRGSQATAHASNTIISSFSHIVINKLTTT